MAADTTYEIHPSIGIARVAPSDDYYLGPEPEGTFPPPQIEVSPGNFRSFRDAQGSLRPQAARFRVFECQRENGKITAAREITSEEARISWRVHVVNRKGAAPKFADATGHRNTNQALRRNNAVNTNDINDPTNKPLIINPGVQSVASDDQQPVSLDGTFKGVAVHLGRMFTEASGRLVFVGGKGLADSVPPNSTLGGFADSDNWFDDTCDGSVSAEIVLKTDGRTEIVKPAWLLSGPYDFAPEVTNLVTLYDLLLEVAYDRGLQSLPNPVYFDKHIAPILRRVVGYQWVNKYARSRHGQGQLYDFTSPIWSNLGDPTSTAGSMQRKMLFDYLRPPGAAEAPSSPEMPRIFGDNYPDDTSVLWMTKLQHAAMKSWASDSFELMSPPESAELLPDALTRMAIESCVGRAFWPGIEVSIAIYDKAIFFPDEAFRVAIPGSVQPGMLTQSMAIPWQSDFLACRWEGGSDGRAWWPAQRPDDVLLSSSPQSPQPWQRGIMGRADMIARWHQLGIVRKVFTGAQFETERTL
jgi:hypothetical protein